MDKQASLIPVRSKARLIPVRQRRIPRLLQKSGTACYHVVSRINGRAFLLPDEEKEIFRSLMRRVAEFCGIGILTYAILDNHFHLLVEVPEGPGEVDDEELLRRSALIYGKERPGQPLSPMRIGLALSAGGETREQMRALLIGRMASLPMFMKILKQRFSILYNRKTERVGTLWEDRFHSVLVENCARVLQKVAAYIDLNAVRAGVVSDPKDYRYSGYGEAVGRRDGLAAYPLFERIRAEYGGDVSAIAAPYRRYLYLTAVLRPDKAQISSKDARRVEAEEGELSTATLLRCRLRYMTRGVVLGSKAYVEE